MTKLEAAAIVVEMYGKFAHNCLCSGKALDPKFSEAVAIVSLAMSKDEKLLSKCEV